MTGKQRARGWAEIPTARRAAEPWREGVTL
jgi:hypothetical protein